MSPYKPDAYDKASLEIAKRGADLLEKPSASNSSSNCSRCLRPREHCDCSTDASEGATKSTSSDDRHFAVIQITLYDDARRERVLDRFGVNTWIDEERFYILKEFFLETVTVGKEEELMK